MRLPYASYVSYAFTIALTALTAIAFGQFNQYSHAQELDTTPPSTSYTQTPSFPDGSNEWYVTSVQFDLQATDLESGVKEINYRIDSGTWQTVSFANTQNLAPNPSFEISGATSSGLADWSATIVDPEAVYSQDATSAPSYPTNSAKISATGGSWHGINNIGAYAIAVPYDNMTAAAWLKTQNVTGSAYFKVYAVIDTAGVITYQLLATSSTLTGTTDWTEIPINFSVSYANAVGIYLDIGLSGPGDLWIDAISINSSLNATQTTVTVGADSANHRIEFYSVDNSENIEIYSCTDPKINCIDFKLDQTPPGNWQNSGAVRARGGSSHELFVFTDVEDLISGLSTETDQYQYSVETVTGFGKYENLLYCNTPWQENVWADLEEKVTTNGVTTAFLETQRTDFCNSNWKVCKTVRFYAEDVAGNFKTKDLCLNGPWIELRGEGVVRSNNIIDMLAESPEDEENTDGLIEVGGASIDFFNSTTDWKVLNSPIPPSYTYDDFYGITLEPKTTIATTDSLIADTGVYEILGNYVINSSKIPNAYDDDTFAQIVFVDGNLRIANNIELGTSSTALFIVKGNVEVEKEVENLEIAILSDSDFYTAYDLEEGQSTKTLNLQGLFSANNFYLQRTLQGTNNQDTPSESFIYEPKYLIQMKNLFDSSQVQWKYIQ